METKEQKINAFFDAYEKRFNDALTSDKIDAEATVNAFTEHFIESSPVGVICGKNDTEFEKKTVEGYTFYKSIGTQSMKITGKEIQLLNEFHGMVTVKWRTIIVKKDNSSVTIDFVVIYLLRLLNNEVKIFAYITEDEQKAYTDNNIKPYK